MPGGRPSASDPSTDRCAGRGWCAVTIESPDSSAAECRNVGARLWAGRAVWHGCLHPVEAVGRLTRHSSSRTPAPVVLAAQGRCPALSGTALARRFGWRGPGRASPGGGGPAFVPDSVCPGRRRTRPRVAGRRRTRRRVPGRRGAGGGHAPPATSDPRGGCRQARLPASAQADPVGGHRVPVGAGGELDRAGRGSAHEKKPTASTGDSSYWPAAVRAVTLPPRAGESCPTMPVVGHLDLHHHRRRCGRSASGPRRRSG